MQSIYVPKYDIHYRINPKNPCELQWSKKPFGPMTAWQKAFTFTKPIRALDIDDNTQQGVVVLNDSSTYVGSGVRVWGRKYYTAGSRLYSLYAIGESKMKSKMKIRVHEKITDDGVIHNVPLHKRAIKDMLKDMHDEDDTENKYNPNDPIVVNDYLNDTAIVTVEWVLTHLGEDKKDKIAELQKQGMSNVDIATELDLLGYDPVIWCYEDKDGTLANVVWRHWVE